MELTLDQGLLILRLVFGTLMVAHGTQKLFGWLGGYGLSGTGGFFESIGFRPGRFFAFTAGASEVIGGLLVVLGLLGPIGPALFLALMIVAAATVHWKGGLFAMTNGIEVNLLYGAAAVAVGLTGFGRFSVDAALGLHWSAAAVWFVLLLGVIGGIANLALRHAPVLKER